MWDPENCYPYISSPSELFGNYTSIAIIHCILGGVLVQVQILEIFSLILTGARDQYHHCETPSLNLISFLYLEMILFSFLVKLRK